ncbi:hypothetical protein [Snodgrassella alvi]|jgi:hypothetical protein|uniref:hypothetical protein n=1 Tax=Snodgrassella alvi TaxID=1196083 RepID=UPI000C1E45DE|nr:hypothetical protein [Snodgrassella alvi]PIT47408.1 hypothetical protein BHC51_05675 [Snodgrassella alvi]
MPEKIIYDSHNPAISLPMMYAKALSGILNFYGVAEGLFILAGGMAEIKNYSGKKNKSEVLKKF